MKRLFFTLLICNIIYPQAGSFDTTFGTNGIANYCFNNPSEGHKTIDSAFQSDGKIVCLIYNWLLSDFELVRFNTDGSIDTTFGTNGYQNYTQIPTSGNYAQHMVIQPDNKILVMGLQQSGANYYWIARVQPDGALDTSFNGTGYNVITLGTPQDRGTCIALQPDGKILLGGTSGTGGQYFTMIRLTTTGAFDTTFGTNGVVQTAFDGSPQSWGTCIAVQPDGKLVMGGYTQTSSVLPFNFGLVRYMPNGSLDTTFGTGGKIATDIIPTDSDQATDVLVQPDGKIVLAGCAGINTVGLMTAVRYLPNGTLDTGFADTGIIQIPNSASFYNSVALQTDGKLVFGGGGNVFRIYRYNSNGIADTTFGNNGFVDGMGLAADKVLIQSDYKIVVSGASISDNGASCSHVIRLNPGELGVREFNENNAVLYPNPTTGVCTLQLQDNKTVNAIVIYDMLGRTVYNSNNNSNFNSNNNENSVKLDLSGYPSGVYLVEVKTNNGIIRNKVVKE